MLVIRIRYVVILSLVYLCLVLTLYNFLWKTHSLERGLGLLPLAHDPAPHDGQSIVQQDSAIDKVLFNFRRRNGFLEDSNNTNVSDTAGEPSKHAQNLFPKNTSKPINTSSHHPPSQRATSKTLFSLSGLPPPSACIHTFYYMWYGNPELDHKYYHWNHRYLPHWQPSVAKRYPQGRHVPPDDIGASFYPELGSYSSRDPRVMEAHMYQIRKAGIGVISVSWYPVGKSDDEGFPPDPLIPPLLDIAHAYSVKVAFHIEPYQGRTPQSVKGDLKYIVETYSDHPAFYKHGGRPLVYMYDSYTNSAQEWAEVLKPGRPSSIRGTKFDCIIIGLLVEKHHENQILNGGFDGFYTYFAADGFSYGSTSRNWKSLANFAQRNKLLFIPSFGPGYDDVRVRPWNQGTTRKRRDGAYYRDMSSAAVRTRVGPGGQGSGIVSVTSFNEWHEGTQIESAIPKTAGSYVYSDYSPHPPNFYLQLTKEISTDMQCTL